MGIKKVLITAGPTWVAIDKVRVISNIASGETGILLADKLSEQGAKVTLVLGPGNCDYRNSFGYRKPNYGLRANSKVKIVRFSFFEELRQALKKELKASRYDFIIHSAAVSDFAPQKPIKGKLKSGRPYVLRLKALPKISADIRRLAPDAVLVLFKLESGIKDEELIRRARKTLAASQADLIVANSIEPRYKAYILDAKNIYSRAGSKQEMAKNLIATLGKVQKD